ncbi:SLAP domain-containing protein [Desulforamulus hydrothermalis]|uniref:SLAP domain-containing protein n=1 Tax=Desulforamulus hydrothermalis TaxID=412895 RepID=UPI00091DADD8|nr:SLAP domain-containing protein [Desulforamulus hydrothermalis]SHH19426.1 SLAP domain-containing protein [Desulforamulus hydrothermalis Lam5 = DSM 18033]
MEHKEKNYITNLTVSPHPDKAYIISPVLEETIARELAHLPPLPEGQVALDTIYVLPNDDTVEVGFYLRNGKAEPVRFGRVPLMLQDDQGRPVARQEFDLGQVIEEVPPYSVRPCEVLFNRAELLLPDAPLNTCKLAADVTGGRLLPLEPANPGPRVELSFGQLIQLEDFVAGLPPIQPGQIDIHPYSAELKENGELAVTLIFRNGKEEQLSIEKLPVSVIDAKNRYVAKGVFDMYGFVLPAGAAGPYTFVFAGDMLLKPDLDLSSWKVMIK